MFASRFPVRPNRLGLSLVRVERVHGRRVEFSGVDLLDRTPVLDVKPWEQHLDVPGWPVRARQEQPAAHRDPSFLVVSF